MEIKVYEVVQWDFFTFWNPWIQVSQRGIFLLTCLAIAQNLVSSSSRVICTPMAERKEGERKTGHVVSQCITQNRK